MPHPTERISALRERLALPAHLDQTAALLAWDAATYLPPGGTEARAQQLATLARLSHARWVDAALADLVAELETEDLSGDDAALVRATRRAIDRHARLPSDLVAALARQRVRGRTVWAQARADDDFPAFAPELRATIELQRAKAAALNDAVAPYDALHDLYERGSTAAQVEAIFEPLRGDVQALLGEIRSSRVRPDVDLLRRDFPEDAQEAFVVETVAELGYDFERGRLDRTTHPFAVRIGPGDVRITTRYQRHHLNAALFGTIHEAGHAIYEQHLPQEHADTPLGEAVSLTVHESQSRLWENLVGRSAAFWHRAYPRLRSTFPGSLGDVPVEAFVAAINAVAPSLIRVEADEVTYHLHVMLRFDLERALIDGSLAVADLREAWAAKSLDLLGIAPTNDREGCLQDVHWSMGMFGYFPTYALGTLLSAQLWEAMTRDLGDLDPLLRDGRFAAIRAWLVERVHRHGSRFEPALLIEQATGAALSGAPFVRYARAKYGALYALA